MALSFRIMSTHVRIGANFFQQLISPKMRAFCAYPQKYKNCMQFYPTVAVDKIILRIPVFFNTYDS